MHPAHPVALTSLVDQLAPGQFIVSGGLCDVCLMPITAMLDDWGKPLWLTSPVTDRMRAARCGNQGPHKVRTDGGLIMTGIVTLDDVQDEAMQVGSIAISLIEHVRHLGGIVEQKRRKLGRA